MRLRRLRKSARCKHIRRGYRANVGRIVCDDCGDFYRDRAWWAIGHARVQLMAADAFWLQRYTIPKLDISSQLPGRGTPYALVALTN